MTENFRLDPFVQPFAIDGTPVARALTKDDLKKIQSALGDFQRALADLERRNRERQQVPAELAQKHKEESGAAEESSPAGRQASSPESGGSPAGGSNGQPATGSGGGSSAEQAMPQGRSGTQLSPITFHCLIVTGYLGKGHGMQQDKTTDEAVAEACERHFEAHSANSMPDGYPAKPRLERIHVILHSFGGSLDSAYKIVLYLRSFAKDIRVYVPYHAKSAATLIAIGADMIVMSPYAELGPLDTQITDPRNPATRVSALDCYRSVDYVRDFGVQTIPRALKVMLAETQALIPLAQLVESATTFAIGSVSPLLEQIKALDFGGWGRTLKIGETYAKALRLRLQQPDSEKDAARIATKLVYGYPHHPYPIDRAEAEILGLTIDTMPKDVFQSARAIAEACKDEARFVGFPEDVARAISQLPEPRDGALRVVQEDGQVNEDVSQAYGPLDDET